MKEFLRNIARRILGEYEIYRIYGLDLVQAPDESPAGIRLAPLVSDDLLRSQDPGLRSHIIYAGPDAYGFGAWIDGELVGTSWYWAPGRYRRDRNFWPLGEGEIKWIQITIAEKCRGRGVGRALTLFAQRRVAAEGYRRAYARVWHSNKPSYRMVEAAGWRLVGWVVTARPFGRRIRIVRRVGGR